MNRSLLFVLFCFILNDVGRIEVKHVWWNEWMLWFNEQANPIDTNWLLPVFTKRERTWNYQQRSTVIRDELWTSIILLYECIRVKRLSIYAILSFKYNYSSVFYMRWNKKRERKAMFMFIVTCILKYDDLIWIELNDLHISFWIRSISTLICILAKCLQEEYTKEQKKTTKSSFFLHLKA